MSFLKRAAVSKPKKACLTARSHGMSFMPWVFSTNQGQIHGTKNVPLWLGEVGMW